MMLVRTYLAPSAIEGLGVFTREPIRKGDLVWRFDTRFDRVIPVADMRDAPAHMQEFLDRYTYPLPSDPENFVVLDVDEGRFMNHADEPNCEFPPDGETGWAVRDIAAGEELTCHYACFTMGDIAFQPSRHEVGHIRHAAE
jgi:SET domain-containing protein